MVPWLFICSHLVTAWPRLASASAVAEAIVCPASEYQKTPLVVDCSGAGAGSSKVDLQGGVTTLLAVLPIGLPDVRIKVSATVDFDIQLLDSSDSVAKCVVGYGCTYSAACTSETDFCILHEGMPFYYSGDAQASPFEETFAARGLLSRYMKLVVRAYGTGVGHLSFSHGAPPSWWSCPTPRPGCELCDSYAGCAGSGTPQCNGSSVVDCLVDTTTAPTPLEIGAAQSASLYRDDDDEYGGIAGMIFGGSVACCVASMCIVASILSLRFVRKERDAERKHAWDLESFDDIMAVKPPAPRLLTPPLPSEKPPLLHDQVRGTPLAPAVDESGVAQAHEKASHVRGEVCSSCGDAFPDQRAAFCNRCGEARASCQPVTCSCGTSVCQGEYCPKCGALCSSQFLCLAQPLVQPLQTREFACQTDPVVKVALARWRQAPLDLVVCVDSSASFCLQRKYTGEDDAFLVSETFKNAKWFVEYMLHRTHAPEVRLGLIRSSEEAEVMCELTDRHERFQQRLHDMLPTSGDSLLAPSLHRAFSMLGVRCDAGGRSDATTSRSASRLSGDAKAVVVITDSNPRDFNEAKTAAAALRAGGAQVIFVKVQRPAGRREPDRLWSLANTRPRILRPGETPHPNATRGVFETHDNRQALGEVGKEVLRQLLEVTRHVDRARSTLPLVPYVEVSAGDIERAAGFEVDIPSNVALVDPSVVPWDADVLTDAGPDSIARNSVDTLASQVVTSALVVQNALVPAQDYHTSRERSWRSRRAHADGAQGFLEVNLPLLVGSDQAHVADADAATSRSEACMQTEPIVTAVLAPWRHAPLDLVICVDSSSSFCLHREVGADGAFAYDATFDNSRALVDQLASTVNMPEVRLALIRIQEVEEVVCHLTGDKDDFRTKLGSMTPHAAAQTRIAPALLQASHVLGVGHCSRPRCSETDGTSSSAAGTEPVVSKAVLVITDGDPNDLEDAQRAAASLADAGAQLLFVRVLKPGGRKGNALRDLAKPIATYACGVPAAVQWPIQGNKMNPGVFECRDEVVSFQKLLPSLLRQLLRVSRRVLRAKCDLPMSPYEEPEASLDCVEGHEILLHGHTSPLVDPTLVAWEPEPMERHEWSAALQWEAPNLPILGGLIDVEVTRLPLTDGILDVEVTMESTSPSRPSPPVVEGVMTYCLSTEVP